MSSSGTRLKADHDRLGDRARDAGSDGVRPEPGAGTAERPRAPTVPTLVFVGGTGRSGTHVVSKLLNRHRSFRKVPNEVRFHCDPGGFPDLLAGHVTVDEFLRSLRGRWWREFQTRRFRGLHRFVPRQRFEAAVAAFEGAYRGDPVAACRTLFWDLLGPVAAEAGKPGLVEQSCDTVAQAPTLLRLFPEARFIHVVRDGRDAAASRAGQLRWLTYPRTIEQGLDWWEGRMRRIDAGIGAVPEDRVMAIGLDELVDLRRRTTFRRLRKFLGIDKERPMMGFFRRQVSGGRANTGRWRRRRGDHRRREIDRRYEETLDAFERDCVHGWRILRRVQAAREES